MLRSYNHAAPNKSFHPTRASVPLINLVSCDAACVLSWRGRVNSSVRRSYRWRVFRMIIVINGSFGVGKTTVARLLRGYFPGSMIFDPEWAGLVLMRLPKWIRLRGSGSDDFQHIELWRRSAVAGVRLFRLLASGPVIVEILDAKGAVINSYNSETPANTGRGARGGGGAADAPAQDDPDAPAARRFGPPPPRVTKSAGMNRLVWHAFTCSPIETGIPGQQYHAGTHLDPKTTWWSRSWLAIRTVCG